MYKRKFILTSHYLLCDKEMKFLLLFVAFIFLVKKSSCELRDILKLCEDGTCEMSESEFSKINSTVEYKKRMFKLISAGVPQILWEDVSSLIAKNVSLKLHFKVSDECAKSLLNVSFGLDEMFEWAFRSELIYY